METGRVRASDAEREEYAERVRKAVGEGRLTISEGDERMREVYATKFIDELGPQVTDLPAVPSADPSAAGPAGPSGRDDRRLRPRRGHGHAPGWYPWPPVGPVMFFLVLWGIWALSGAHVFWPAIPLAILTLVVLRRLFWWRHWSRRGGH